MSAALIQSVLFPAGPQASSIHQLWHLVLWTSAIVFGVVSGFVLAALIRRAPRLHRPGSPPSDVALNRAIVIATITTALVLVLLLTASVWAGRSIASLRADSALSVAVVGHQWWWEFEYEDAQPSRRVLTANELHVPLRRPVVVKVSSRDVIHSFWVPALQGKRDLIPGVTTAIWLQADQPGRYRGQCAEFCGLQHAHMAFDVVVEPEAQFESWLDHQRQPSVAPEEDLAQRGRDIFLTQRCGRCHAVRGTDAAGQAAPDLTHVASRLSLAAGTLTNTATHRRAFVTDPQAAKPGTQMPANPFGERDMAALLAYLDTLQ